MNLKVEKLSHLIVVGDRILIKPATMTERTQTGLLLPPGVLEKEVIQSGYVVKVGPGYPIPSSEENSESWKQNSDSNKYFPLQAKEGDLAIYLQKHAFEIEFNREKFFLVPNSAILLLYRDEEILNF
ncbi:MAG: co-chaperone GroES family protein [Bacteroidota bacterium]